MLKLLFGLGFWGAALLLSNNAVAQEAIAKEVNTSQSTINSNSLWDGDIARQGSVTGETPIPQNTMANFSQETALDNSPTDPMGQVTSVSQLTDVQPTDWAFQALQSLVERYGCIEGYPDRTYRGNRAMTRYEFAAGLNACLERINELIKARVGEAQIQDDLTTLQRLQSEFAAELATLPKRIDSLEASVSRLEAQQFSTTTTLTGEILFAVSGVGGEDVNGNDIDANIFVSNRAELNLNTSFFGQDLLRARLAAQNTPNLADITGTNFAKLSFTGDNRNDIELGALFYRFPVGRAIVFIGVQGIGFGDFTPTLNPYINSSLLGNVGNFSGESPIYALNGGRGIGVEYRFNRAVRLSLGYLASAVNDPRIGLFDGPYRAIAQLTLFPTPSLSFGLTYVHSYKLATGKGSQNAEDPFDGAATSTNSYGLEASYQVTPNFSISGWVGLINATAESNPNKGSDASIFTWATTFAFPDFGGRGNLAGFIIGQPPKVIENDVTGREDPDTSLHIEAFYRYQVTNNISITPGVFVITNPEHNSDNSLIYVGTIRTSFAF